MTRCNCVYSRNYAELIATNVNPDEKPREDAALVAAYCFMLEKEVGTAIYSKVLVNLSCMNQTHRDYLIDLAKKVRLRLNRVSVINITNLFIARSQCFRNNTASGLRTAAK